mmetsp:Transcript_24886/g.35862  ORF Transcript_24886/g.35862 Transcript_24886/m.35862 type:complete len:114 (-) Transcript_24886:1593-1934(-)
MSILGFLTTYGFNHRRQAVVRCPWKHLRVVMRAEGDDLVSMARTTQRVYSESKPWWCQPWTILGTGGAVVSVSWTTLHGWFQAIAFFITVGVVGWWYLFLVVYPQTVANEEGK